MRAVFAAALASGLLAMGIRSAAHAQADSTASLDTVVIARLPRTALQRAIVPGLGQLYNRHYLKIPVVYAGLAGFIGSALLVNQRYLLYRHAYLYTARLNEDGSPVFPDYERDYEVLIRDLNLEPEANLTAEEIAARRQRLEPQLRAQRDHLRRNRDLLYFGTVIWYGLTILDAYVSAHLFDFDVSESLAVRVHGLPGHIRLSLRWKGIR